MKCPYCGSILSKVIDKRGVSGKGEIRRRRECLKCTKRYTTYEGVARLQVLVLKKDGRREEYSQQKLLLGIEKALEKRPDVDKALIIVERIESKIRVKGLREIPSSFLGKSILTELKKTDPVAYLRFASVYRKFEDLEDFEKELKNLT